MWLQIFKRLLANYILICFVVEFCRSLGDHAFIFSRSDAIGHRIRQEIKKVKIYSAEGQTFKLHCENDTKGEFHKVDWLTNAYGDAKYTAYSYEVNGVEAIHQNFQHRIKRIDETSLEITNARRGDSGSWECKIVYSYRDPTAKNAKQQQTRGFKLMAVYDVHVASPPMISNVVPDMVAAPEFFEATASCEGNSMYPFNLTWTRINGQISSHVTITQTEQKNGNKYYKKSNIYFNNMTADQADTYLCVAKNFAGQVSREIIVKLQARPRILNKNFTVQANLNKDQTLTCQASGQPRVSFTWKFIHNYKRLELKSEGSVDKKFSVSKTNFWYNYLGKEIFESTLTIRKVQRDDWGIYTCVAENAIGYEEGEFSFKGHDVPKPPALLHTEDIEATQITLHWLLDEMNGKTKSVIVQHRKLFDYDWVQLEIYESRTSYTVIHLDESTAYEFRVKARNSVGYSKFSPVMSFTTRNSVDKIDVTRAPQENSGKIIGNLDLVSLTAIVGGVVVILTCFFAMLCFIMQDNQHKKSKERHENRHLVPLNSTSSNATSSTACLHTISTLNR